MVAIDTTPTLEEQLAEARAQIDHWKTYSSGQGKLIESGVFVSNEDYAQMRAQIAAKDAALERSQAFRIEAENCFIAARAQIAAKDARVRVLAVALEYALQKMWEYGFTENDLQPVRNALSIPKPRRLTPEEAGEIADSIEASLKGQDNG